MVSSLQVPRNSELSSKSMTSGELKFQLITISSMIHEPPNTEEADGVAASPLYQKLPAEVRRSIYLYLVKVDRSINVISQYRSRSPAFDSVFATGFVPQNPLVAQALACASRTICF